METDAIPCRLIHTKKRLEQTEWDIILGYARRVRALPSLRDSLGLAGDCIEALSNPPTSIEPISPNVHIYRRARATQYSSRSFGTTLHQSQADSYLA